MIAITHLPSPNITSGLRTFVPRTPIDYQRTVRQHAAFCQLLEDCGAEVVQLTANLQNPDCAFVEDTAIVLDEIAIMASMGADDRRAEPAAIEPVLAPHRTIERIQRPAKIEGGDVLRVGRTLLAGRSQRTNAAGIAALADIARPLGYRVREISICRSLHLKTACCALDDERLLINPNWIDARKLGFQTIPIAAEEPWAANISPIGDYICMPAAHRQTAELIETLGYTVRSVDLSEFAKAEAGVTCLSVVC